MTFYQAVALFIAGLFFGYIGATLDWQRRATNWRKAYEAERIAWHRKAIEVAILRNRLKEPKP